MRLKPNFLRRKLRSSSLHAMRMITPTNKQFSNSCSVSKASLSTSCFIRSRITLDRSVRVYSKTSISIAHRRGYKFITSASSSSQSQQGDTDTSLPSNNSILTNHPIEDSRTPEEIQRELDDLLDQAYRESKIISSIVTMNKRPSKEHKRDTGNSVHFINAPSIFFDHPASHNDTAISDTVDSVVDSNDKKIQQKVSEVQEILDIQDEVNAVEVLLSITSHPNFHKALAQQREQNLKQKEKNLNDAQMINVSHSLHGTFISVVNWLSSTLSALPTIEERNESQVNILTPPSPLSGIGTRSTIDTSQPTKQSILLMHILHLSERSWALNLPLSLPQYKTIISLIAQHSSMKDKSLIILDLSTSISKLYSQGQESPEKSNILGSDFFSGALRELLKRNHLRDMVELLHGMQNMHHIDSIDLRTAMELLNLLKKKVDDTITSRSPAEFDETDAMELAMMLQRPIVDELKSKRKELEDYEDEIDKTMGELMDREKEKDNASFETYDEGDKHQVSNEALDKNIFNIGANKPSRDSDSDGNKIIEREDCNQLNEEISLSNDIKELNNMLARLKTLEGNDAADLLAKSNQAAKAILDKNMNKTETEKNTKSEGQDEMIDKNSPHISAKFHVNPDSGEVEDVQFVVELQKQPSQFSAEHKKEYDEFYRGMTRDVVYCRDESWKLPDVVPQLEQWNGDRGLLFSKEFEAEIFEERTGEDFPENDIITK